ncbi:hypothetical protein AVEN_114779-1 [Araneus ventricosus]|uniref:Uncharacterized protein n=1 Tax=Araneus ventricosus TaxID=182803 RepID=A0A4Y2W3W8_ARAVE|nr:hypothetical protein AVEN_114779-1 [Araneus ventricosus]
MAAKPAGNHSNGIYAELFVPAPARSTAEYMVTKLSAENHFTKHNASRNEQALYGRYTNKAENGEINKEPGQHARKASEEKWLPNMRHGGTITHCRQDAYASLRLRLAPQCCAQAAGEERRVNTPCRQHTSSNICHMPHSGGSGKTTVWPQSSNTTTAASRHANRSVRYR